jgi:hypothetical protein
MREHSTTSDAGNTRKEWTAVAGLLAMATFMFWLGWTRPPGLKVPSLVTYLLAAAVAASALALVAKITRRTAANHGLIALTLLAFSAVGAWIALPRPGAPGCLARLGRPGSDLARPLMEASETTCRVVFGSGGLLVGLMGVWAVVLWRSSRR